MERRNERIEALLERYFEAQTTAAEERELREFFTSGQEIPRELQYARTMFGGLEVLAGEKATGDGSEKGVFSTVENEQICVPSADGESKREIYTSDSVDSQPGASRRGVRLKIWAGAAAAAVAAVGLFVLVSYFNRPYCYINGVPVRDAEIAMQATVYFEQLEVLDKPMESLDGMMQQIQK